MAAVIQKRDEFNEDLDFVVSWGSAYYCRNSESAHCRRFLIELEDEKIMTTVDEVVMHDFKKWPMKVRFN